MRNSNFTGNRVDTGTLPKIGGSRRDAEIWKSSINNWFRREGITTDEKKFSYIIAAAEDDIVREFMRKKTEVNRALTLDECVGLIKRKYWRENQKENKLRQLKHLFIEPKETVYNFNTKYLDLYDQLKTENKATFSVIDYENALRPRDRINERVAMADVDNLEDTCRLAEKFESIIYEYRGGNEMCGSYTTNIRNNCNSIINYGQIERSNCKNNFSNQYNKNAFNIWIGNNNRNQRNFRNSPINIETQGIQNNNLNKYTKPRQNTHNYYRFVIDNNNNNLNISNDNNISYHCRNRKILKPNIKISSTNSSTNNNNKNKNNNNNNIKDNNNKVNNNNDKDNNNINNVNENIINNNSINNIINNGITNLGTNNNNNNNYNNDNDIYNNEKSNNKNDMLDNIVNVEQNKFNVLKMDNFSENNNLANTNNSKCETNNNIIITKEENKNNFKGSANIKKNQDNNIEINSIVIINNKENINSNSKNKNIIGNSENISNKINSHKIVKEDININESVKVDGINNRTNKSITSSLVKEINIIESSNSKVDNIQITSNANKNEQFINEKYSINNIINIKARKIDNNNSPIEFSKIKNVDSDKEIKIEEIKKKIKIAHICIQNKDKNKININKLMMPKPEIALKKIINYRNNRVDTKRTIRNYRYKRK